MQLIYEKPLTTHGNAKLIIKNNNEEVSLVIYAMNDINKLNNWFSKLQESKKGD